MKRSPSLCWTILLACAALCQATVTNVTQGGGVYASIGAAITAAQSGDRLLVSTGVYAESITVTKNLHILGGYDDSFTSVVAPFYSDIERNESYAIYVTGATSYLARLATRLHPYGGLFCGSAAVTADRCAFSFHQGINGGVWLQNASICVLSNCSIGECRGDSMAGGGVTVNEGCTLELTGNAANIGNNWAVRGGGIRVFSNATARISAGAKVLQNTVEVDGGGIYGGAGSSIIIDNSTIGEPNYGNYASNSGGGICVESAVLRITNTAIIAQNAAVVYGGGVYAANAAVDIADNVMIGDYGTLAQGNRAGGAGGGMHVSGGTLNMRNATVRYNMSQGTAGGLNLANETRATIRNVWIDGNLATTFGGGLYYTSWGLAPNYLLLADTVVSNNMVNSGASGGGGLYLLTWYGTITLTNCSVVGNYSGLGGGGMQIEAGTVTLHRVLLMSNNAYGGGGALAMVGGTVTATDSQFLQNHAWAGGAVYMNDGALRVYAHHNVSQISVNTAEDTGGGLCVADNAHVMFEPVAPWSVVLAFNRAAYGGGLAALAGAQVTSSGAVLLHDNKAALDGGGICASNAILASAAFGGYRPALSFNTAGRHGGGAWLSGTTLSGCTLGNNTAGDMGGGAWLLDDAVLLSCAVAGNVASNYGGGVALHNFAHLINVAVTGNTAVTADAGGIDCNDDPGTPCTIRNCLVADNHSAWGAAGCVVLGAALVESSTIAHNHGIGIGMDGAEARNLVVWGNTGGNIDSLGGAPTITYCCSAPGIDATGCLSNDPQFANVAAADFRLLESSPCIDTGENQLWWMTAATDLDGNPRIYAWHEYRTDMGCYEFIPEPAGIGLLGLFTIYKVRCTIWQRRRRRRGN